VLAGIVFFAIGMFRGGFGTTVPVTVVSERAGRGVYTQAHG
jgi:phospholipid/cholesterol/gamma-HCH transport system substrate-binding protein